MHFKPSTFLVAVAFSVTASAAAFPAPDPVAAPNPAPVADAAPTASPSSALHPIDTTGFSAEIVADEENQTCSLVVKLPSMGCEDELKDYFSYGYPRPHACWKDGMDTGFTLYRDENNHRLCSSATVDFREDGTVQIANAAHQYASFKFNIGTDTGAFAIMPGQGLNPEGYSNS